MKLYSVITIVPGWPSAESQKYGGIRTVAICTEVERAKEIVEKNIFDIFETSYYFAVITEFESDRVYGGLSLHGEQFWYKWEGDRDNGKYIPSTKPIEYNHVLFNF